MDPFLAIIPILIKRLGRENTSVINNFVELLDSE